MRHFCLVAVAFLAACRGPAHAGGDVPNGAGAAAPNPSATAVSAQSLASTVTIHRDRFGVPHVFGATDASTAFGFGYAQAEDNFWQMEENFVRSLGRASELHGESSFHDDKLNRTLELPRLAREEYGRLDPKMRAIVDGFAAGINHFLVRHPETRPRLLSRIEPWYPLAFIRYNYYQNGFARGVGLTSAELRLARRVDEDLALSSNVGSNGWVVNPSRSASGHALLFINPHLPFFGSGQVYEGHVHSDEGWNFTGYTRFGFPLPYVGHNEHLGWVSTDNAADVADLYAERFDDPARPLAYRYGGGYRTAVSWVDTIRVKTDAGTEARAVTLRKTHHGPIVAVRDGAPLALRMAKLEADGWLREWYDMTRARSLPEFKRAMQPLAMLFGNAMYADREGNTFYVYNAAVPKRSNRFDWTKPVDGSDPATEWQGFHTFDELPQLTNPPSGWMQNCNTSPFLLTDRGNPDRASYPKYMALEGDNPRGAISRRMLAEKARWTFEEWTRAAFDTRVMMADSVLPGMIEEARRAGAEPDDRAARRRAALDALRGWNHRSDTASVPMTVFTFWRASERIVRRSGTPDADVRRVSLDAALDTLEGRFGKWNVPWGEINRLQRTDESRAEPFSDDRPSVAVPGVSGADGAVFTFYGGPAPGARRHYGVAGGTYVSVVEFGPQVRALSIHVFGASGNPASRHFMDQSPMYARGEFKPAWLTIEEIRANLERSYRPGQ